MAYGLKYFILVTLFLVHNSTCQLQRRYLETEEKTPVNANKTFFKVCNIIMETYQQKFLNVIFFDNSFNTSIWNVLQLLYVNFSITVFNESTSANSSKVIEAQLSLVIIDNKDSVSSLIPWLMESRSHIILIPTSRYILEPSSILEVWSSKRLNKVLGVFSMDFDAVTILVPLSNNHCPPESEHTCDFLTFDRSNYTDLNVILSQKKTDMGGRSLKISMFNRRFTAVLLDNGSFTGFDGEMVMLLQRQLNLTVVYMERLDDGLYGFKHENGTFFGSLGDIVYRRADIAINGVFIKDYKSDEVEFTIAYGFDKLCVYVPSSNPIPNWKSIFLCFETEVWICIVIAYSATSIFWIIFVRFSKTSTCSDRSRLVLSVYGIFLLIPLAKLPNNISERLFVAATMLSSLLLATCFQGSLLTLLSRQLYEKEINTLADLDQSGLLIHTKSMNLLDTFDGDSPLVKSLQKKMVATENFTGDILDIVATERDIAAIGREYDLKLRIGSNYTGGGRGLLHIVEDCPRTYHLTYFLPRNNIFYHPINDFLGRVVSSGIVSSPKINSGYSMSETKYKGKQGKSTSKNVPEAFTLENLKIAFALLLGGFILSFVVFFVEHYL